jgi:hypothetical protein
MQDGQMKVWLSPLHGGAFTRLKLTGALPSSLPVFELRRLISRLSFFSGYPLECVLSVDKAVTDWCDWWHELLDSIPARHLQIRYKTEDEQKQELW